MATKKTPKTNPSWSDVKTKLGDFHRAGLMGLVQGLYSGSKNNKAFLHARFSPQCARMVRSLRCRPSCNTVKISLRRARSSRWPRSSNVCGG